MESHNQPPCEISVLLVENDRIRELNLEYRGLDEPTDVLTFESGDPYSFVLGDVVISVPYAKAQAVARRDSLENELALLAVHGSLHLLGYDDIDEAERGEMLRLMYEAVQKAGLSPKEGWHTMTGVTEA